MAYEIRAMSLAEVLASSFRILRDHFVPIAGVSAILNVPVAVLQALLQGEAQAGAVPHLPSLAVIIGLLGFALVSPIVGAATTYLIGEVYLGRAARIGEAFRVALGILVPLAGTSLLLAVLMIPAALLLIIPAVWLALGASLLQQVMVIEGTFGMAAIRRSLSLMKGQRGRAFLIFLVVGVLSGIVNLAVGFVLRPLPWLDALASGLASAVGGSLAAVALVVLYFEIRCRKEAFEIQHLARLVQAGGPAEGA